jgi:hypothetical protein
MTMLITSGDILDKVDGQATEITTRWLYSRQMQLMDWKEVLTEETAVTCSMRVV